MKESNTQGDAKKALGIIAAVSAVMPKDRRGAIMNLEKVMLEQDQVEVPVKHGFSGGIYSREIVIPAGTLLTGRIHKFDHFDIMLSGDISVSTDNEGVKRLTGLNIMEGKAGKKRAGYAHTDTHWITFHSAEERDPEEMYEFLTTGSFEELDEFNLLLDQAMSEIEESERVLTAQAQSIAKKAI